MSTASDAICTAVMTGVNRRSPTTAELVTFAVLVDDESETQDALAQAYATYSTTSTDQGYEASTWVYPIVELYQGYFDRVPDSAGLDFWVSAYHTYAGSYGGPGYTALQAVSENWVTSTEFVTKYGSLDNTDFITQLYENILHRDPDTDGLNFWVGQLNSDAVDRAGMMVAFATSPECQGLANDPTFTFLVAAGNGETSQYDNEPLY